MTFELCIWGFIVQHYVPISEHSTREAAVAAMKAEWARREGNRTYTDMGTFSIREKKIANPRAA